MHQLGESLKMSPFKDPQKRKEYRAKYYRDNKERILAHNQAWVELNRERRNQIALRSYHRRKGHIKNVN